jgi:hypothetical protein
MDDYASRYNAHLKAQAYLAEGNICCDMSDAFEYELLELLDWQIPQETNLALTCYGRSEIDTWSIHSPVDFTLR